MTPEKAIIVAYLDDGPVVQWWDLAAKTVGVARPEVRAEVNGSRIHALTIDRLCPPEWAAEAWEAYQGATPRPTHRIEWQQFRPPVFVPLPEEGAA